MPIAIIGDRNDIDVPRGGSSRLFGIRITAPDGVGIPNQPVYFECRNGGAVFDEKSQSTEQSMVTDAYGRAVASVVGTADEGATFDIEVSAPGNGPMQTFDFRVTAPLPAPPPATPTPHAAPSPAAAHKGPPRVTGFTFVFLVIVLIATAFLAVHMAPGVLRSFGKNVGVTNVVAIPSPAVAMPDPQAGATAEAVAAGVEQNQKILEEVREEREAFAQRVIEAKADLGVEEEDEDDFVMPMPSACSWDMSRPECAPYR